MTKSAHEDFDVAIVGAGPVGAYLANLLGGAGFAVLLVDREGDVHPLPRAVHFDGEVMRAFQAAGLAEEIARIARASSKGMHFVAASGKTLLVRRGYEGVGPHGWASNYYSHQPHLERALRGGLLRYPQVAARFGHEVGEIADDGAGVTLSITDLYSRTGYTARARYVVGCDGARSLVRRVIGSENEDLGLHQAWLVVDAILEPDRARARALPEHTVQLCDPARPMTIVYVGNNRHRWEIMLMPGDDPAAIVQPAGLWPLLARWIGPEDGTLERAAVYTFHSVIARSWRKGRLLLAGDACHQTPPFLGQGMCAGIRDALNLSWKLHAVLEGRTTDALLDTYESERRPHVRSFIELAVELGAIIQATDPEVARERDRSFAAAEPRMFDFPQPQLGPGIRMAGPPPLGQNFPQPRLDDGRRLDEARERGFALLGAPDFLAGLPDPLRTLLQAARIQVVDAPSREIDAWLAAHEARGVLIRPDAYIHAVPGTYPELETALAELARAFAVPRL
jgi:3-(3-hydroxy-phenyl)propionate hydroxylase